MSLVALALLVASAPAWLRGAPVAAQPGPATEPPIGVVVAIAPTSPTLGERVRVTVTVTHSDELLVTAAAPARREFLTLVETLAPLTTPGTEPGTLVTEFGFTFAAFNLGHMQPADVPITWLRADGTSGTVLASPEPFDVRSTVAPSDAPLASQLRPLKPQRDVGGAPLAWERPALAGGAVVAVLVLAGGAAALRRRLRDRAAPAPGVGITTEDRSRRRLEELAASDPLGAGDYERYYGTIATVVRDHLTARFEFPASAWTTHELIERMTARGVDRWQARLVGGLLDRCDQAVFAGRYPDSASADHDLTLAFEIVELSRPTGPSETTEARPEPVA